MGIIDTGLEVGASCDWITPIASIIGDLAHGGSASFLIDIGASPYSGAEIERHLRRHGVKTWGAMIVSGNLMLSVPKSQAQAAQDVLERAGVPVIGTRGTQRQAPAPRARPTPSARRADFARRSRIYQALRR